MSFNQLDSKISCGDSFEHNFKLAVSMLSNGVSTAISFVNPFSYNLILKEHYLIDLIDQYYIDGALLCYLHGYYFGKIGRASFDFSSVAGLVFKYAQENNMPIALIGASPREIPVAVDNIKRLYNNLEVSFYSHGYFDSIDSTIQDLKSVTPKLIILGLGTPMQERVAIKLKLALDFPVIIITCGGFLSQTALRADYYHPIVKKLGIRWAQRFYLHSHVRERVLKDYPRFLYSYILNKSFNK
ncbi:WecB/TagA/CpsF family glycosyltransferase [Shewanella algae]|uniref:WecB/TagA/CpsF family glycosyltransferase n=1 Tax=Shewanella algae TaxID=38313 RepID=UPI00300771B3